MKKDYILKSRHKLTLELKKNGINTWNELTDFVRHLPYGRNSYRTDLSLIIKEQKGTCSSKHALLKKIANLNAIPEVKLILGIYKMNATNTPKIGDVLKKNNLEYLPEAHCYLKINDEQIDFTSSNSDFSSIKNDILLEKEIEPQQVAEFKVKFHKTYLKTWIDENEIPFSFDNIWRLREECIANLSG
jgi:hypothetical protein